GEGRRRDAGRGELATRTVRGRRGRDRRSDAVDPDDQASRPGGRDGGRPGTGRRRVVRRNLCPLQRNDPRLRLPGVNPWGAFVTWAMAPKAWLCGPATPS